MRCGTRTWILGGWLATLVACASGGGGGPSPVADTGHEARPSSDPSVGDTETEGTPDDGAIPDSGPFGDPDSPEEGAEGDRAEAEPCFPQCEGRECGDDGCGGICGYCPYGYLCKVGLCVEYCVPDCTQKACGDDGCGGLCGDCEENEFCGEDFACHLKGCVPACGGKECGPDGCGGSCGACPGGQVCDLKTWRCVKDTACHEVTAEGRCVGSLLQWCEAGVLQEQQCDVASGLVCGYSHLAKKYACISPEQCQPQCAGKACGPDQCGGVCGECGDGLVCSTGGKCGPPCGDITEKGACEGDLLRFCHQGILITYDCASVGKHCQWDPTGNSGKGWFDCL